MVAWTYETSLLVMKKYFTSERSERVKYKHGVFALVSQTSFYGETNGGIGKCRLFTQARQKTKTNKQREQKTSKRRKNKR